MMEMKHLKVLGITNHSSSIDYGNDFSTASFDFVFAGDDADEAHRELVELLKDITKNKWNKVDGDTSDGYHTFNELYYHRMMLFSVICNQNKERAWKSKKHHDGTMYDNYFIVGISTDEGDYTYHYHLDHWDMFNVDELEFAPEWDGHKPEDITRLLTLVADIAER